MEHFLVNSNCLDISLPKIMSIKKYFDIAKCSPKYFITQNKPSMKQVFVTVPAATWAERVYSLQEALQTSRISDAQRRSIITSHSSGISDTVDNALNIAFLDKYEELMEKVLYGFDDFWPYQISRTNQNLMVFNKLNDMDLVEYVMKRL